MRKYRARRAKRAQHPGSLAYQVKMHGYVPRFFGGPHDGKRADFDSLQRMFGDWLNYPHRDEYQRMGDHLIHQSKPELMFENRYTLGRSQPKALR